MERKILNYNLISFIFGQLFHKVVREKISYQIPMELAYYSCRKAKLEQCYWCGSKEDLQLKPQNLKI